MFISILLVAMKLCYLKLVAYFSHILTPFRYNRVCISSSQEVFTTECRSQFLEIVIYSTTSHRKQLEEGGQTGTHGTDKHKNESTDPLHFCFICNCGINELLSVSLKGVERSR